jgi:hypothetical protein
MRFTALLRQPLSKGLPLAPAIDYATERDKFALTQQPLHV